MNKKEYVERSRKFYDFAGKPIVMAVRIYFVISPETCDKGVDR